MFKQLRADDPWGKDKQWRYPPKDLKFPILEHKSCSHNCSYVQFGSMPHRRCKIYKDVHIWTSDGNKEFKELGHTVADLCPSFKERL
jgi:hypothetical protein